MHYPLSLQTPAPPAGSFDSFAAQRGEALFKSKAKCDGCHLPPTLTDVLSGPDPSIPFLHSPGEIAMDPAYAQRSATKLHRTTPLRAPWQPLHFHDGSAETLMDIVDHYDGLFALNLTAKQKEDLVEYFKTL